jgi:hypothetical protein
VATIIGENEQRIEEGVIIAANEQRIEKRSNISYC